MTTASLTERPLTQKQESFCLFYFALKDGAESARRAGYPHRSARQIAQENLTKPDIQARLAELADRATPDEDALIASEIERKRILSKIYRTDVPEDKVTADHVIRSIQEHNRMERIGQQDTIINNNNDNRSVTIVVKSEEGRQALEQLKSGKLPQLQTGG